MTPLDRLRSNLRAALEASPHSMRTIADMADVSHSAISEFLSGSSRTMKVDTLIAIAPWLDTHVGALLGETGGAGETGVEGLALIAHDCIAPNPLNPRASFDKDALVDLAESIRAQGVLEPIGVWADGAALGTPERPYLLAFGERRWRAIGDLISRNRWPRDKGIPALIKPKPDDADMLTVALIENLQRREIAPLDEGKCFAALHDTYHRPCAEIAAEIGKTPRFVEQRIALWRDLGPAAKAALDQGKITIDVARGLARVPDDSQDDLVERIEHDDKDYRSADDVLRAAVKDLEPAGKAFFDLSAYDGDTIHYDGQDWLCDTEQFKRLQLDAAKAKVAELKQEWAWAELERGAVYEHRYDRTENRELGGAIVLLEHHSWVVRVFEGLVDKNRAADEAAASAATVHTPSAAERRDAEADRQAREAWAETADRAIADLLRTDPDWALRLCLLNLLAIPEIDTGWYIQAGDDALSPILGAVPKLRDMARDTHGLPAFDKAALTYALERFEALDRDQLVHLIAMSVAADIDVLIASSNAPLLEAWCDRFGIDIPAEYRGDTDAASDHSQ